MNEALALRDLHFGYGRRPAVRGVSLALAPGDCYGFLGHNGAGKTTVMRLALGLLAPQRGSVRVFGRDARAAPRQARNLIGALIERPGFHLHATAKQNLLALARLQGMARRLAAAEADRVLEATGLARDAVRRVGAYSLGMRQRLGVAAALLGGPPLLLLDEPSNGLDPEGIAELRALLSRLTRDEGVAVLLSSHQLAELEGLCTRIGVLRDGEMVVEGGLDELRRSAGLRHVVRGRPLADLAAELSRLQLEPVADGDRLLVDLRGRAPAAVVRALANAAELTAFAPEQATLETIYLRAHRDGSPGHPGSPAPTAAGAAAPAAPAPPADAPPAEPRLGGCARPLRRSAAFETGQLLRRRTTLPLLLLPCAVAGFDVHRYSGRVAAGLELVQRGERFSADAGSGYVAFAQALTAATPVLGTVLLWLASQSIAADLAGDTLRNTLARSVTRRDVVLGKLSTLLSVALGGWAALVACAAIAAGLTLGFGDLEEVSRHGDRDLLAAAADVRPTALLAAAHLVLPLAALVAVALAASAVARRPARALGLALGLALGPELLRGPAGESSGWLLTSHLPMLLRDDSALGYLDAVARGAADALWPSAELAVTTPLVYFGGALAALAFAFGRLRIP